jgi:hypothetical protein
MNASSSTTRTRGGESVSGGCRRLWGVIVKMNDNGLTASASNFDAFNETTVSERPDQNVTRFGRAGRNLAGRDSGRRRSRFDHPRMTGRTGGRVFARSARNRGRFLKHRMFLQHFGHQVFVSPVKLLTECVRSLSVIRFSKVDLICSSENGLDKKASAE